MNVIKKLDNNFMAEKIEYYVAKILKS